jgi:hypothetical protein
LSLYDDVTKRSFISFVRPWEQSMIAERAILPPFPNVSKSEDTPVVAELIRQRQVTLLDRPELYIYTYHGMNTWDGYHWKRILRRSRPLGAQTSGLVSVLLNSDMRGATQLQTRPASSIHKWESGVTVAGRSQPFPV